MKIEKYTLGALQANCYLIWENHHVLIVDPGGSSKKIIEHIKEQEGIVDAILLTHGHFDHIAGVEFFYKHFQCPIYISEDDEKLLHNTKLNCSLGYGDITIDLPVNHYETQTNIKDFSFMVIDTPGHTNGSVLLIFDSFICSGDVLFKQSIGRSDFPTGSNTKMSQSIQKIKQLDPEYIVYPGHGELTTIQEELLYNPFF